MRRKKFSITNEECWNATGCTGISNSFPTHFFGVFYILLMAIVYALLHEFFLSVLISWNNTCLNLELGRSHQRFKHSYAPYTCDIWHIYLYPLHNIIEVLSQKMKKHIIEFLRVVKMITDKTTTTKIWATTKSKFICLSKYILSAYISSSNIT